MFGNCLATSYTDYWRLFDHFGSIVKVCAFYWKHSNFENVWCSSKEFGLLLLWPIQMLENVYFVLIIKFVYSVEIVINFGKWTKFDYFNKYDSKSVCCCSKPKFKNLFARGYYAFFFFLTEFYSVLLLIYFFFLYSCLSFSFPLLLALLNFFSWHSNSFSSSI